MQAAQGKWGLANSGKEMRNTDVRIGKARPRLREAREERLMCSGSFSGEFGWRE
jgi:hypothetical protein